MRISCTNRFILLHVPRTGVSSIMAALDDAMFERAPPTLTNKLLSKYLPFVRRPVAKTYFRAHETAAHVKRLLPAATFEGFYKIAFVRNPYSWLVSLFELVRQSPNHRHFERISTMRFSDYVDWEIQRGKRAQHPYLFDDKGNLLVNFVGHFERLADDAANIFRTIGVPLAPLPRVGQFTRYDYRELYNDACRRKVASHWAKDLELFGYDFDGLVNEEMPQPATARSRS